MKNLAPLLPYLLRYKGLLGLGVLFVCLKNILFILSPKVISEALDLVFDNLRYVLITRDTSFFSVLQESLGLTLLWFGLIILILSLVAGMFMYWMRQTIIKMSRLIEYDFRKDIFAQYTRLDMSFYRKNKIGDMMARITEDVSKVRMFLGPAILYGINMITLFSFVIYFMWKESAILTLYSLLPLPFLSASIYLVSKVIHTQSATIQTQLSRLNSLAQEFFSGIRIIKSFVHEKSISDYFDEECEDFKKKSLKLVQTNALFLPLMLLFIGASTIITIYIGGLEVIAGRTTPGTIAQFVIYVNMLTWPVASLGWITSIIQQASVSMARITDFMSIETKIKSGTKKIEQVKGNIRFDHVTFTYENSGITALDDITFEIHAGEKVLIVGKTGSGKTSLADLVMRVFDPTKGNIYLDGTDIQELNIDQLRHHISYVPQDVFLFSESVRDNIIFGNKDASEDQIRKYAAYAQVDNEIESMANGYESILGERGVSLSGGQKQRIALARGLIKEPSIIILDDVLSAVDANTEIQISTFLKDLFADKTVLFITHRINPFIPFDKVAVLEDSKLVDFGTIEEVTLRNEFFRGMQQTSTPEHLAI